MLGVEWNFMGSTDENIRGSVERIAQLFRFILKYDSSKDLIYAIGAWLDLQVLREFYAS